MADDTSPERKDDDTTTTNTPVPDSAGSSTPKRRLKAPQSIREQSELATAKAAAPQRRGVVGKVVSAPFRILGRLIAPVFRFLGRYRFFRAIGYVLVPPYFRTAWQELRLVTWPNFRQTRDLTFAVLVFSVIFGLIVAAVDYGLDKLFRAIILN